MEMPCHSLVEVRVKLDEGALYVNRFHSARGCWKSIALVSSSGYYCVAPCGCNASATVVGFDVYVALVPAREGSLETANE